MLIRRADSLLLVVDIQQKLAPALADGAALTANAVRLLGAAGKLGIPAFVSEQYVRGLGPSLPEIRAAAVDPQFFEKTHFSCAAEAGVVDLLRASGRHQVVLCGSEAHVCVLQSAFGLQDAGFEVFLAADAAASRSLANRDAAIARMQAGGIRIATTEMILFEWLGCAATDEFRALLPLIK